jgi:hypothetical protein
MIRWQKGGGIMKETWERTELPICLDLKQMNELIKPVFPGKRVMAAERIGTGCSNSNYKIHLQGSKEPFVVRFYSSLSGARPLQRLIARTVRSY